MKSKESSLKRHSTNNMRMTWQTPKSTKLQEMEPNTSALQPLDLTKQGFFDKAVAQQEDTLG